MAGPIFCCSVPLMMAKDATSSKKNIKPTNQVNVANRRGSDALCQVRTAGTILLIFCFSFKKCTSVEFPEKKGLCTIMIASQFNWRQIFFYAIST